MGKRAIMIDSGCAPTREFIEKYGLEFMGMKIILDGQSYVDGESIDHDTFFAKIPKVGDFHTAPPLVWDIIKKYEAIKARGYTELFDIHFSSRMSQLITICHRARDMITGIKVNIIDTRSVSVNAYLIAEKVIDLIDAGKSDEEISELLPEIIKSTYMLISVSTLKYLVKNGRIGKARGLVGTLLNMKPILGIDDGTVAPVETVRGMENAYEVIAEKAVQFIEERPYNIKICVTYGIERNKELLDRALDVFMKRFKLLRYTDYAFIENRAWPTVACHSGPEVFAIAVYGEKEPIG